jgi:aspartate aminotransferase-like enzyme
MKQLRVPGPTPCPQEVLQAMGRQMMNHRGPEFAKILNNVTDKLKQLFQTKNDLFLLTGSGTGGLEAAVVNTMSPGDKVLSVSIGVFGDRFATIAKTFGAEVIPLKFEWGKAADVAEIKSALKNNPDVKAVLVTHNETSTGVTNDLEKISAVVKEADKLLLVDAISSLGSIDLPIDKWGCDVTLTGSQKGWMVPPGLVMAAVSKKAWEANTNARMPRFYWDFGKAKSYLEKGQTPWTPAISIVFAMSVALDMMLKEGTNNIFTRHTRLAEKTRQGVKALGLKLFADEKYASNTVTSIAAPEGLVVKDLLKLLREKYDVVLSGGQAALQDKIFRIGHLGWVHDNDIDAALKALQTALPQVGFKGDK